MILLWFAFDLWGATAGGGDVAYMAHVGGLVAGAGLATVLLKSGIVEMESAERSIFDMIAGNQERIVRDKPPAPPRPRTPRATEPLPVEEAAPGERVLIAATCGCGRVIRVSSNLAGRHVRCPICADPVQVPRA